MAKKKLKSKVVKSKAKSKPASKINSINTEVITAALSSVNQTVLIKVCRLCESKEGPFLNIFDSDKVTAKKIEDLMPFRIAENDDLPHKICFRCSAKLEELHEFVQKCVNTQVSLRGAIGKKGPLPTKKKEWKIWEETLNKSNMSNEAICDALIKKAMEGINNIPLDPLPLVEETKPSVVNAKIKAEGVIKTEIDVPLKQMTLTLDKCDAKVQNTRSLRQNSSAPLLDGLETGKSKKPANRSVLNKPMKISDDSDDTAISSKSVSSRSKSSDEKFPNESVKSESIKEEVKLDSPKKPDSFNIMDHVCMIKVNGVGILFQCKLCNRNFLKKEVVLSHACAKNGVPIDDFTKNLIPPEPPKVPTVKYISTKTDNETKKQENKSKPKIGPASKVKRDIDTSNPAIGMLVKPRAPTPPEKSASPSSIVELQNPPSLKSRYKLVPGPNNTFMLVEDQTSNETRETTKPVDEGQKTGKVKPKDRKQNGASKESSKNKVVGESNSEIIDLEAPSNPSQVGEQPYPVGLFQTLSHTPDICPTPTETSVSFTTPAMKKQSYTVVQTGNPSKLLISSKPQPNVDEPAKKKLKRTKTDRKEEVEQKQPFTVTLEDAAPPKDPGFFTFINVDPLLQPSYVLPTDNIIQESQISTSTPAVQSASVTKDKDKYTCNMCGEKFSREKKLLSHIQSHFNKMDEDEVESEKAAKGVKRRTRKS